MYRIHVTFTELICRLIRLNEDRFKQYSIFRSSCRQPEIRNQCNELAHQSASNLEQLNRLVASYTHSIDQCPPFSISPSLWKSLDKARESYDVHFIASIIYKIEDQFGILYKFVCNMFSGKEKAEAKIVQDQYQKLLKSKASIPHLFLHRN